MLARGMPKTPFSWASEIEGLTTPPPGSPHIPQRWGQLPATAQQDRPAHPDGLHSTRSSTGRARTRAGQVPGQTMPTTGRTRHTRPDAGHAAPVCIRYQTGHTGQIRTAAGLEGVERVRQTTLFRTQNIFHASVYKCCLCNLTFPWIHV